MKIAILHSAITRPGGDVTFCFNIAKELNAKIYTNVYDESVEKAYNNISNYILTSGFRYKGIKGTEAFLHIAKWILREIDADFYIYSAQYPAFHAIFDSTPYLYYCHTPNRILYDLRNMVLAYYNKTITCAILGRLKIGSMYLLDQFLHRNIINPKQVVTNSNLVYQRYIKAYNRKPRCVINPPIDTARFYNKPSEDFYLSVGRFEVNKRFDMIIKAFSKSHEKLIIIGNGPDKNRLVNIAKKCHSNVEFKYLVSSTELLDFYSRCKAFIFSAMNEDFGYTLIEALASGKPVISINEGGPLEYLNQKNSFLFNDINGLKNIITTHSINNYELMRDACLETSNRFDSKNIAFKLLSVIKEIKN